MTNLEAKEKLYMEWQKLLDYSLDYAGISEAYKMAFKALEQEPLTDKEQRIFLAAMSKEELVCKEIDDEYSAREVYEDSLVSVCRSIERKVKKALWE